MIDRKWKMEPEVKTKILDQRSCGRQFRGSIIVFWYTRSFGTKSQFYDVITGSGRILILIETFGTSQNIWAFRLARNKVPFLRFLKFSTEFSLRWATRYLKQPLVWLGARKDRVFIPSLIFLSIEFIPWAVNY